MSGLRGFGTVFYGNGAAREWYAGSDGVRRWNDNDQPIDDDLETQHAAQLAALPKPAAPEPMEESEDE